MNYMNIETFLDFKFISSLQANPSKTAFAFLVAKPVEKKNEYTYDLWTSDGNKHQKCLVLKNKGSYVFESDRTLLVQYTKNKDEEKKVKEEKRTLYYRYHLDEKRLSFAYEFPFPATIVKVLGTQLLLQASLTVDEHHLYLDQPEERKAFLAESKKQALYEDIEEIPFYFNNQGMIANKRNQIFLYHTLENTIKPLVDSAFSVNIIKVSQDLKRIVYTGSEMKGIKQLTTHVFMYHVDHQKTDILYHENDCSMSSVYLVGDDIIIAGTDMKDYGINQNPDFFVLKDKKLELLTIYRGTIGNSVGSDVRLGSSSLDVVVGDRIYFVSTVDDHNEIHSLNRDGSIKMEYQFNGSIEGLIYVNQQFYSVGLYRQKLQEIYQLNLVDNRLTQLTRINQNVLKNMYVATPKEVLVKGQNHVVKGFVLYPKDFDPFKSYPAILDIHGGPKTVYGKVYYHEMQYWANLGYFVFFANPRGSDGKGDGFADIRGLYGTIDYEDLMNFTDHILAKIPQINHERLFVTGGSYGGFMTNWIVGHTNRFRAAVTQRSISNWLSFHGTSDIGFYFSKDQTGGHPMTDTEKLWNQSPIKYAKEVKTPLLFIHSDQDYRCPIEQAMQFFTVLKEQGLETKLVWFKGENHELSRSGKPQARIKRLHEITSWFEHFR